MRCSHQCCVVGLLIAVVLQGVFAAVTASAQPADPLQLLRRITELSKVGRYAEAIPLGRELVSETERMVGRAHPMAAMASVTLADLHRLQGQLDEAEPMLRSALAIYEKAYGSGHPNVAQVLASLSYIAIDRAQYREAEQLLTRVLAIRDRELGSNHPDTLMTLVSIARVRHHEARYAEAEALFQRALDGMRTSLGAEHAYVSVTLNNLAVVFKEQGKLADAEVQLKESLRIQEAMFGRESVAAAAVASNLGELHVRQGRYAEAEILYRRSLGSMERALGPDHPDVANQLANLASLFTYQGRASEAEGLLRRALTITETAFGPEHPDIATRANNLAHAISAQHRLPEAETLYRRSLAIREAHFGADHPAVAIGLDNLGAILHQDNRFAEAEPFARRSLSIRERSLGATHPLIGNSLNNLASILDNLGRHEEAHPLLERALKVREAALGSAHPEVAVSLHNLGSHYLDLQQWDAAFLAFKQASAIWTARRTTGSVASEEGQQVEIKNNADPFLGLVVAAYHAAQAREKQAALQLRAEAFESAQWVTGVGIASAITRMSARIAAADVRLAELVRESQDLGEAVRAADRALIAAASQPPQLRNSASEEALARKAQVSSVRLKEIGDALGQHYPEYAMLTGTTPLALNQVVKLLGSDEALLFYAPTRNDTYLWAVTRSEIRWIKIGLGAKLLADQVKALRCGLDAVGEWQSDGGRRCLELLRTFTLPDTSADLSFDLVRAHELYQSLFGQIADLVSGKHILIVASGPLTTLPFQVLVVRDPPPELRQEPIKYARADWLSRHAAVSVLPSVASLGTLRRLPRQTQASVAFIGFGNPLLSGPDGSDQRAWARQTCLVGPSSGGATIGPRAIARPLSAGRRGPLADVDELRRQVPLPETTDELCTVAQLLGASQSSVYLGERATERTLKALSANGDLKRARILHFATHGLLPGEAEGIASSRAEPALILTPPLQASEEDDGLLTASEVAQLKLDADWVVMSACNTAGADKVDSEAMSGLARAFFYAGSRALLVSHWYVDSPSAVALTSAAFAELKRDPAIGRAEALRRSMLALMDSGDRNAHPANWAPFSVVGEGAAATSAASGPVGSPVSTVPGSARSPQRKSPKETRGKQPGDVDWRQDVWRH